jgi:hypothetical protein
LIDRITNVLSVVDVKKQIVIRIGSWFGWTDTRLISNKTDDSNSNKVINFMSYSRRFVDQLWRPTIYIRNLGEIQRHGSGDMSDTVFLDVTSGRLTWVRRYKLTIRCNMDFSNFPFDEQTCYYQLGSTMSNTSIMVRYLVMLWCSI